MICCRASTENQDPQKSFCSIVRIFSLLVILISLTGCSLGVMAGKMLIGDPMVGDDFKSKTGKSLTEKGCKVAILCSTPESVKDQFASLQVELLRDVSRKMSIHKIDVVKPHLVASWIDDNGGKTDDLGSLAQEVDADYIVDINVEQFSYIEENSPNLYRGRCNGAVTVFAFAQEKGEGESSKKRSGSPRQVYQNTFKSVHPVHQPIPADQTSELIFRKKFMDRVGDEISRLFYKHRAGVEF